MLFSRSSFLRCLKLGNARFFILKASVRCFPLTCENMKILRESSDTEGFGNIEKWSSPRLSNLPKQALSAICRTESLFLQEKGS